MPQNNNLKMAIVLIILVLAGVMLGYGLGAQAIYLRANEQCNEFLEQQQLKQENILPWKNLTLINLSKLK